MVKYDIGTYLIIIIMVSPKNIDFDSDHLKIFHPWSFNKDNNIIF